MNRCYMLSMTACVLIIANSLVAETQGHTARVLVVPDQFATIQQAMDAAEAGDTVQITPGVYDETVVFKDGIRLVGTDREECRIQPTADFFAILSAEDVTDGLISNLTFDGNAAVAGEQTGVGIRIKNGRLEVRGCLIENLPRDGILVTGAESEAELVENTIRNNAVHGIAFYDGAKGTVSDSTCDSNGSGIVVNVGSVVSLRLNTCQNNTDFGVQVRGTATLEENDCTMNLCGMSVHGPDAAATLKRNTCNENRIYGLSIDDQANARADENSCDDNGMAGIIVRGIGTQAELRQNSCSDNKKLGISFKDGSGGTASGNICERNQHAGIDVAGRGTNPVLAGNQCNSNGTTGISVFGMGAAPQLKDNTCRENRFFGIKFSELAGGIASGNLCIDNGGTGIVVAGAGTRPTLEGNQCNNNGLWGIRHTDGATPIIAATNQASGNKAGQIQPLDEPDYEATKPPPLLPALQEDSLIPDTVAGQTLIVPDQHPTIQNAIDAAKPGDTVQVTPGVYREALTLADGIKLVGTDRDKCIIEAPDGATALIMAMDCKQGRIINLTLEGRGITTSEGKPNGIVLYRSRVSVSHCVVQNMNGIGIFASSKGGAAVVQDNISRNCAWSGIGIGPGAEALVVRNTCENNEDSGIIVTDAVVSLANNVCRSNELNGITIRKGASGLIEGNTCSQNRQDGIAVEDKSTNVDLSNNSCSTNVRDGIRIAKGAQSNSESNTCAENGDSGIVAIGDGTAPLLTGNTCRSNTNFGVFFGGGATGVASGNICESNGTGIAAYGDKTSPVIDRNECRRNENNGILIGKGALGNVVGNSCNGNKDSGILVWGKNTAPRIHANVCQLNGSHGIHLARGAVGTVTSNSCVHNEGAGITVRHPGTAPKLEKNECLTNTLNGIFYGEGAGGVAIENRCQTNKLHGIAIRGAGTSPIIQGNTCALNSGWGIAHWDDAEPIITSDNKVVGNKAGQIGKG